MAAGSFTGAATRTFGSVSNGPPPHSANLGALVALALTSVSRRNFCRCQASARCCTCPPSHSTVSGSSSNMPPASLAPDLMRSLAPGSSCASATSPNDRNSKAPHCETPSVSCNRRRRWCPLDAGIRAGAPASITLTICSSSGAETSPSRSSAESRLQPSACCVSCVRSASRMSDIDKLCRYGVIHTRQTFALLIGFGT